MIPFSFIIEKKRLERRLSSDLQHKLRVALKCYTIIEFQLLENNMFQFKKRHRHFSSKLVFTDPNKYQGTYHIEEIDETHSNVIINSVVKINEQKA